VHLQRCAVPTHPVPEDPALRRLFLVVTAVVLVDASFFAAVTPLLPEYSEELSLSKTSAGLLAASYAAGTFIGAAPGAWLVVRWGAKPALGFGLALMTLTSIGFGFGNHIVLLDAMRFTQGIGGAFTWTAGMTWLVSAAPADRRGGLLGATFAASVVGALLGPALGGAASGLGPEPTFSAVAVVGLALGFYAWRIPGIAPDPEAAYGSFGGALKDPLVRIGLWTFVLPALFTGVVSVLVPLRLSDLGASGPAIGAVFVAAAAVEAVVSPWSGRLSDRYGRLAPMRAGLLGAGAMAALLPLFGTSLALSAGVVGASAMLGGLWAPALAMLSEASERVGLRLGIAFALSNAGWSAGHLVGTSGGAALADVTRDAVPCVMLTILCAATFALLGMRREAAAYPPAVH
jgi:MFS family permease